MSTKLITVSNSGGVTTTGYGTVSVYPNVTLGAPSYTSNNDALWIQDSTPVTVSNRGRLDAGRGVNSAGLVLSGGGLVVNYDGAVINGAQGVLFGSKAVSTIENNGLIEGQSNAVRFSYSGSVFNYGTIKAGRYGASTSGLAGINTLYGGTVYNGAASDPSALIVGIFGVFSAGGTLTATNFGTIQALGGVNAKLAGGVEAESFMQTAHARIFNGEADDTSALIKGQRGVHVTGYARVTNYGTIAGGLGAGIDVGYGTIDNGGGIDGAAVIKGGGGIVVSGPGEVTVYNSGLIDGTGGAGVLSGQNTRVTNGTGGHFSAVIEGVAGLGLSSFSTVINYATIIGFNDFGIQTAYGSIVNGSGSDHQALIQGRSGIRNSSGGTVRNFGTVAGLGGFASYGIGTSSTGRVINGSVGDSAALIEGYTGISLSGSGSVTNFGTIHGDGGDGGSGVFLNGGAVTNGSATRSNALIDGYIGAEAFGASTIVNFGTIAGQVGTAVHFYAPGVLVVEAGSAFQGLIIGGGGTLELGGGTGTLTGLLAGGNVTVSGSMATTTFNYFAKVQIDAPANFALAGTGGTISAAQVLTVFGTLGGTGALTIAGGITNFGTGASLAIAKVSETSGSANFTATTLTVADAWTQTGGTVSAATGDKVSFTGTNSFSGTLGGTGTITFTGGATTLAGTTISATSALVAGAAVTLSGTLNITKTLSVSASTLTVAAAGVSLSGGGAVALTSSAANAIVGATTSATLVNVNDKINGGGQLGEGKLVLVNNAGATIDANTATTLVINTGTSTVANGGLIESISTGGLTIAGALSNTGTLSVSKGTISVAGAVSGAGIVKISGGTAAFAGTFSENVTFSGTAATVLQLGKSQTYAGQISGFSKTGTSTLDLLDIAFGGSTKATYSGTSASGILTVTDGTHTAHIALTGDYTAATFTVSSDGHGGTNVVDPTTPRSGGHTVPLASAIAAFAPIAHGAAGFHGEMFRPPTMLAAPRIEAA